MATIVGREIQFNDIQAIIFDKDGTLEDSQSFLRELAIKRARLIEAQIPGIGEPLLMAFGITDNILAPTGLMAVGSRLENEIAAAAYIAETGCSWFEAKKIASNAFTEANKYVSKKGSSSLFAGSLETLQLLSAANLKLGILSADSTVNVEKFVASHQLSEYIQLAMGAETGLNKPDPQLFIQACQKLEVEPAKTIMVGDSQGDIAMAQAAGAAGTIGIYWENSSTYRGTPVTAEVGPRGIFNPQTPVPSSRGTRPTDWLGNANLRTFVSRRCNGDHLSNADVTIASLAEIKIVS